MRQLKNILYVQTQGAWLHKKGENILLDVEQVTQARLPIHKLEGIVCFGRVALSPALMAHCCENGITITHLNRYGRFQARVEGAVSGNVLLRRAQYRIGDVEAESLAIAKHFIVGKVHNQCTVIKRYLRDYQHEISEETRAELQRAQTRLGNILPKVLHCQDAPTLLGHEGDAGAAYFAVFSHFIRQPDFTFEQRSRRPPRDPINALLSFFYTLMTHDCRSALESSGLDPASGFFHQLRPGRASLALDMLEEFRPMVDRFVLSLINRQQLNVKDFSTKENGAVMLTEDSRKTALHAWQTRKQQKIKHEWFEETVEIGVLPWLQAQILARHLRGDCDAYVPFLWK